MIRSINSNYPMMSKSEWDNAPFNEEIIPEKDFNIVCSQSLSKTVNVKTSNYYTQKTTGPHNKIYEEWDDTSDTNWYEEFINNDLHTPLQLIELFREFLIEQKRNGVIFKSPGLTDCLIKECANWNSDELDFEEE